MTEGVWGDGEASGGLSDDRKLSQIPTVALRAPYLAERATELSVSGFFQWLRKNSHR